MADDTNKKRILIVSDAWHPQVNGVVRTYEHLVEELTALGHAVKVIGPADFPRSFALPVYPEIRLAVVPYPQLKKMIAAFAPDSLHIATEGPLGWAARRYALKHKMRFSTAYHTQFPAYLASRVQVRLPMFAAGTFEFADSFMRRFHAKSAVVITTTRSINHELRERRYKARLAALPRGVSTETFHPAAPSLFDGLKRPVALYVGRIAVEKNIDAFLSMPWDGSKVIVGDGPGLAALKAAYPAMVFAGRKTGAELAAYYQSADIFVFPSRTDTFGIVLLEALACGLPVAAYNVAGPADIIARDVLGVLDDDLAVAAAGALALKGEAAARAAYVGTHFTWPVIAKHFLKILERAKA